MGRDIHEARRIRGELDPNPNVRAVTVRHLGSLYYVMTTKGEEVLIDYSKTKDRQAAKRVGVRPGGHRLAQRVGQGHRLVGKQRGPAPGADLDQDDPVDHVDVTEG